MIDTSKMATIEFIEDNDGAPESYMSIALRVVPELEEAQARIKELERELKLLEGALDEKVEIAPDDLMATMLERARVAERRVKELEQFARDIAAKLGIDYTPPVSKGECAYLKALEEMKERLAEAKEEDRRYETAIDYLSNEVRNATDYYAEAKQRAERAEARNALLFKEKADAIALITELEAQLAEAKEARDSANECIANIEIDLRARDSQLEEADTRAEAAEADAANLRADLEKAQERISHWQEEHRDMVNRWQRMTEERNGLRAALEEIAKEENWDKRDAVWYGDEPVWEIAQAALKGEQSENQS